MPKCVASFDVPKCVASFDVPKCIASFDVPKCVASFDVPKCVASFDVPKCVASFASLALTCQNASLALTCGHGSILTRCQASINICAPPSIFGKGREGCVAQVSKRNLKAESFVRGEIRVLRRLDHPCICRLLETFEDDRRGRP